MKTILTLVLLTVAIANCNATVIVNDTTNTLTWTVTDDTTTAIIATGTLPPANATGAWGTAPVTPPTSGTTDFYRNAVLQVTDGTGTVYLHGYGSAGSIWTITPGRAPNTYLLDDYRSADYESVFWAGFLTIIGLAGVTIYIKAVRAGRAEL